MSHSTVCLSEDGFCDPFQKHSLLPADHHVPSGRLDEAAVVEMAFLILAAWQQLPQTISLYASVKHVEAPSPLREWIKGFKHPWDSNVMNGPFNMHPC